MIITTSTSGNVSTNIPTQIQMMEKERKELNKDAGSVKRGIVAHEVTGKKERKKKTLKIHQPVPIRQISILF